MQVDVPATDDVHLAVFGTTVHTAGHLQQGVVVQRNLRSSAATLLDNTSELRVDDHHGRQTSDVQTACTGRRHEDGERTRNVPREELLQLVGRLSTVVEVGVQTELVIVLGSQAFGLGTCRYEDRHTTLTSRQAGQVLVEVVFEFKTIEYLGSASWVVAHVTLNNRTRLPGTPGRSPG